jgi:carbon storage regulator CsrA
MLVLSRQPGEAIHLGHDVRVTVLGVSGRHVRLGIEAPSGVRVLRAELAPSRPPLEPARIPHEPYWQEPACASEPGILSPC